MPGLSAYLLNSFLLCALLIAWLRQVAAPLGLVDMPDQRKRHDGLVPLCGGIAIFAACGIAGLTLPAEAPIPGNLWIGFAILVSIGIADDRWNLPVWPRLVGETAAAILLVGSGLGAFNSGLALSREITLWLQPVVFVGVVAFAVGTMNAINMLDGVDGLAGASAAAALFWIALIAFHVGRGDLALHALLLLSALLAFLVYNMRHPWRSRASVFMGEAGSITLGAALAYFVVALSKGRDGASFVVLLWVLIVPIADTLSLIVRRLRAGRSPLSPDRWHLHHLLLDLGFSPGATAILIASASAACGAIAYLSIVLHVAPALSAAGLVAALAVHGAVVAHARRWAAAGPRQDAAEKGGRFEPGLRPAASSASQRTGVQA